MLISRALPRGFHILGTDEVLLGRGNGCQLPLLGDGVSRKHARIYWDGSSHVVADLGSTNGTAVNGKPITEPRRLNHEDVVTVGAFKLRFIVTDAPREELLQRHDPRSSDTDRFVLATRREAQLAGHFSGTGLVEACQLIELNKHSGEMRVETAGLHGWVRFRDGVVVDAKHGIETGEQAARRVFAARDGQYSFARTPPGTAPPAGPLSLKVSALAMELARAADEKQRAAVKKEEPLPEGFADEAPSTLDVVDDGPLAKPHREAEPGTGTRKMERPPWFMR